jgi:phage gp46-like protein
MADIPTIWDPINARGDWNLAYQVNPPGNLDLATAALISIFTDRASDPNDVIPDGSDDPRGWWGDLGTDRPIGSKIWLRMREKQTPAVLAAIKNDITEATRWFVDDRVADAVSVDVEYPGPGLVTCWVTITRNRTDTKLSASWAWQGVN